MKLHAVSAGKGAPPIVFVHGFACTHEDWRAQLEHFSASHRVLACDLPGHGATPGRAADCSIERYGAEVARLLGSLDARAVLVGHSMGCRVVLQASLDAPRRVAALALVDGSRMGTGDAAQAHAAMRAAIDFAGYPAFADALFRQMFFRPSAAAERVVARAKRLPAEIGAALFPDMVRWDAARLDAALGALRVPLLVIQSTQINAERKRVPLAAGETTPWLDLVRSRVKGAAIEVIPGVGHFAQLEAPETVNRLLQALITRIA